MYLKLVARERKERRRGKEGREGGKKGQKIPDQTYVAGA